MAFPFLFPASAISLQSTTILATQKAHPSPNCHFHCLKEKPPKHNIQQTAKWNSTWHSITGVISLQTLGKASCLSQHHPFCPKATLQGWKLKIIQLMQNISSAPH